MGGLRKHMPITRITFMISCLAIAGIFPFSGFFSKDEILAGAWSVASAGLAGLVRQGPVGRACLIAALGTAFYMWRLYFLVFAGEERTEEAKHAHESPPSMTVPLVVLAFFATIAGFLGLPHLAGMHLPDVIARRSRAGSSRAWPHELVHAERARRMHDHGARQRQHDVSSLMGVALVGRCRSASAIA